MLLLLAKPPSSQPNGHNAEKRQTTPNTNSQNEQNDRKHSRT
jgi:hypothetical protein